MVMVDGLAPIVLRWSAPTQQRALTCMHDVRTWYQVALRVSENLQGLWRRKVSGQS